MSASKRSARHPAFSFVVAIALGGCRAADEAPVPAAATDETAAAHSLRGDSVTDGPKVVPVEPLDDDPTPLLPGEGDLREFNLLLVNRLGRDATVFASAGAARVVLDTVMRSDSVYVDIRLRSDQVHLEAEDDTGEVVTSTSIDLVGAGINRWEMVAPRRDRTALGPGPPQSVAVDTRSALFPPQLSGEYSRGRDVRPLSGRQPAQRRMNGRR
ncbi:MAG: hypothetical protein ACC682_13105 [Gemmatimonadota bacterium]